MDYQIPWYGGISNRQILIDSARGLVVGLAVFFSLFMLFGWAADFVPFISPHWKWPICGALTGVLIRPIARWCRRT
jgi:hypothetical protein